MNNEEYVQGALRTEAPVTEEMLARFRSPEGIKTLMWIIGSAIQSSRDVDRLKKWLYYGKGESSVVGGVRDVGADPINPDILDRVQPNLIRLLHAAIGINTEAGEILQALMDHLITGFDIDYVNLSEEGGDVFWYMAILADALKTDFTVIQDQNNRKLRTRYPDKFTEHHAINRDLEVERLELEK